MKKEVIESLNQFNKVNPILKNLHRKKFYNKKYSK